MTSLGRGIALSVLGLAGLYTVAVADEPKFKGTVLDQATLGSLNGDYIMKMTMLDMEAAPRFQSTLTRARVCAMFLRGRSPSPGRTARPKPSRPAPLISRPRAPITPSARCRRGTPPMGERAS